MCGIFGFVTPSHHCQSLFSSYAKNLFILSESRGKEAAGLALKTNTSINLLKTSLRSSAFVNSPKYKKLIYDSVTEATHLSFIGHSRLATHGSQDMHDNNQPISRNGVVCVHNGIITNDKSLWDANPSLTQVGETDTEIFAALMSHKITNGESVCDATVTTFSQLEGAATIAMLFDSLPYLLLATNTGSLYYCYSAQKDCFIFASERYILRTLFEKQKSSDTFQTDSIRQLSPGQAILINEKDLSSKSFNLKAKGSLFFPSPFSKQATAVEINDLGSIKGGATHKIIPEAILTNQSKYEMMHLWEKVYSSSNIKRCSKCLLTATMPGISFNEEGLCNHCQNHKPQVTLGHAELEKIVAPFRGDGSRPDCLVPFSGGRDSCYGIYYLKEKLGMTPLAYTYDWGMLTDLGRRNQARVVGKLGIEHIIVSADIDWKRENIRKNINAWLRNPTLGMIPLLMAGDKQLLYFARQVMRQNDLKLIAYSFGNKMEEADHKIGFTGVTMDEAKPHTELSIADKLKVMAYYGKQYLFNPAYLNSSLIDSCFAFWSVFIQPDDSIHLFNYIDWNEEQLIQTIVDEFGWEKDNETIATWRIDDGTAAFYNYIYLIVAGFTENDCFRSCQIRKGEISREEALELVKMENQPRLESIEWYAKTIGFDINSALKVINSMPRLY